MQSNAFLEVRGSIQYKNVMLPRVFECAELTFLFYCFTVVVHKLSVLISETESSPMVSFGCVAADF